MSDRSEAISDLQPAADRLIAPKYEQLRLLLLKMISSSQLPIGDVMPSEAELVQTFGVSRVTVRRALQCLMRDGIIQSEQGVGHVVRTAQVNPPVGIIFGNYQHELVETPSHQLIVRKLQHILAEHGYANQLYLVRAHRSELRSDRARLMADLRKRVLRGLIAVAWPCTEQDKRGLMVQDDEVLNLIRASGVPLVGWTGAGLVGAVALDYASVGRLGAEYFLDKHLSPVALIAGFDGISEQPNAVAGFHDAFDVRGQSADATHIVRVKELSQSAGYAAMRRLASLSHPPRAVVIADDIVARGAMSAILEMGIDVPGALEVATLYIRDTELFFPRPFVRIEVDEQVAAQQVISQLLKAMENPQADLSSIIYVPTVVPPAEDEASEAMTAALLLDAT